MIRFVTICALILTLVGCSQQQEASAPQNVKEESSQAEPQVIVPDKVKAEWSAVKLTVRDVENGSEAVYTVPIGGSFAIPGSAIRVNVGAFLPNFIISAGTATSRGRGVTNPAVQIQIAENGETLFDGWLFAMTTASHHFSHPRYDLSLSGFVPSKQAAEKPAKKG